MNKLRDSKASAECVNLPYYKGDLEIITSLCVISHGTSQYQMLFCSSTLSRRDFEQNQSFYTLFISTMSRTNLSGINRALPSSSRRPYGATGGARDETEGFQTVSYKNPATSSYARGPSAIPYRGPPAGHSKVGLTKSYYKEQFLPVAQQNAGRLEAQKSQKYLKGMFTIGTIVRAPLHEQDTFAITKAQDHSITESNYGRIHTKLRKMIIVGLYDNHYVAVPIYSHGGRGLEYKDNKLEYISVRDHRTMPENIIQQSALGVLATGKLDPNVHPYHPKSTAHITSPHSRKYDGNCIIEGILNPMSTTKLLKLYNERAPKP